MSIYKRVSDETGHEKMVKKNFGEIARDCKPCPKCGKHHIRIQGSDGNTPFGIWCTACGYNVTDKSLRMVEKMWNEEATNSLVEAEEVKAMFKTPRSRCYKRDGLGIKIRIENEIFDSIKEAATFLEMPPVDLGKILNCKGIKTIKGFEVERFADAEKHKCIRLKNTTTKREFRSVGAAAKFYGCSTGFIKNQLKNFGRVLLKNNEVLTKCLLPIQNVIGQKEEVIDNQNVSVKVFAPSHPKLKDSTANTSEFVNKYKDSMDMRTVKVILDGKEFNSIKEAADSINANSSYLSHMLSINSGHILYKGHDIKRTDSNAQIKEMDKDRDKNTNTKKRVLCVDTNEIFDSISAVAKLDNIRPWSVSSMLKQHGYYISRSNKKFVLADDNNSNDTTIAVTAVEPETQVQSSQVQDLPVKESSVQTETKTENSTVALQQAGLLLATEQNYDMAAKVFALLAEMNNK